ncbi:MAG: TetR/AcrR family transcriptional regulator [Pseudomonadota bacterium]
MRVQKLDYIRRAASELFNKKGFDATSLDEVAEKIGISKPSIYYYYKNKSELLLGCYIRTLDLCDDILAETHQLEGSALDKICHFTRQLIFLNCAKGAIAVVSEIDALPAEAIGPLRARSRDLTRRLKRLIADGVADGSLRPDLSDVTTLFIMGAVNWTPRWYREDGPMTPTAIADAYIGFLVHGVAAEADRTPDT